MSAPEHSRCARQSRLTGLGIVLFAATGLVLGALLAALAGG